MDLSAGTDSIQKQLRKSLNSCKFSHFLSILRSKFCALKIDRFFGLRKCSGAPFFGKKVEGFILSENECGRLVASLAERLCSAEAQMLRFSRGALKKRRKPGVLSNLPHAQFSWR